MLWVTGSAVSPVGQMRWCILKSRIARQGDHSQAIRNPGVKSRLVEIRQNGARNFFITRLETRTWNATRLHQNRQTRNTSPAWNRSQNRTRALHTTDITATAEYKTPGRTAIRWLIALIKRSRHQEKELPVTLLLIDRFREALDYRTYGLVNTSSHYDDEVARSLAKCAKRLQVQR